MTTLKKVYYDTTIMESRDLWYTAGIIDGEGYIGIARHNVSKHYRTIPYRYYPCVKVASVDKRMIDYLHGLYGGYQSKRIHAQVNHKLSWMWELKSIASVNNFLIKISSYLKIKNKQAKVVMDFLTWKIERRKIKRRDLFRYTSKEVEEMEKFYREIRKLNFRGIPLAETE